MAWKKRRRKMWIVFSLLMGLLFVLMVVFSALGSAAIPFSDALRILLSRVPLIGNSISLEGISEVHERIVLNIRLPRILLAATVGLMLSGSGVIYQSIFKNPMADPYILGVSSGAALGATIGIILSVTFQFGGLTGVSLLAFVGALLTTFFVYTVSRVGNKAPVVTLLLSGIAVSFFLQSLISMIMTLHRDQVERIMFWTFGSVATASWKQLLFVAPVMAISVVIYMLYGRALNILSMGEEDAKSLGVDVEKTKIILLIVTALSTASAVGVSGIIGFVGLVIPHVMRFLVGPDIRVLMPASLVGGAVFLVLCDALSRLVIMPIEIPIGVVTALVGAPYFLSLIVRSKNKLMRG